MFLENKGQKPYFVEASSSAVFLNAVTSLGKLYSSVFGFCGLPTLLNRPLLEVSISKPEDAAQLAEICAALGTDYRVVQDRVGLVTPRVVCMIINEACYTLQEGTASIRDIDKSMKLGTSYPRGPFEWANLIGVSRVYEVLEAMWQDTHEERYKVCPLLKTMYLRGASFTLT
jgi:3-hydroxybutyryl-CoA dehydrogenase